MARVPAAQRREDFIDAAVRVVARAGIAGATTRRIAEQAKAPLAALHYCFPSKEALFFAVYEKQAATLEHDHWLPRKNAGLGRTAGNLLRQIMSWYQSDEEFARASMELFYWVARQDEELGRRSYDIHTTAIAKSLHAGLREGDGHEALVEPMARMIVSSADGLLMQWIAHRDWSRTLQDVDLSAEAMERLAEAYRVPHVPPPAAD